MILRRCHLVSTFHFVSAVFSGIPAQESVACACGSNRQLISAVKVLIRYISCKGTTLSMEGYLINIGRPSRIQRQVSCHSNGICTLYLASAYSPGVPACKGIACSANLRQISIYSIIDRLEIIRFRRFRAAFSLIGIKTYGIFLGCPVCIQRRICCNVHYIIR